MLTGRHAGASCDTKEMTKCPPLKSVAYTGGHDAAAQAAFTGIADPKLLALMRAKSYTAVGPDDYKPLEDKAATLGLLTRG